MKKFYDKFFKVNDDEVISNSTFVANIVFSMFVMVICVAMMSMSAFAYFSYSLSSSHNTIVSASYSLSVVNKQGVVKENGIFVLDNSENTLDALYSFEISKAGTASVGFGQVIVCDADGNEIINNYTDPIGEYGGNKNNVRYYEISVPAEKLYTVKFIAHWGTCSAKVVDLDDVVIEISEDEYVNTPDTIEVVLKEVIDEEFDENLDEELLGEEEISEDDELIEDDILDTDNEENSDEEITDDSSDTNDEIVDDEINDDVSNSDDETLDEENQDFEEKTDEEITDNSSNSSDEVLDEEANNDIETEEEKTDEVIDEENQEDSLITEIVESIE